MLNDFAIFLYSAGTLAHAIATFQNKKTSLFWLLSFGLSAILLHSYLLYHWIDLSNGQNLTDFNLLSLATWVTGIFVMILGIHRPVAYLNIYIFPLAAISIFLASQFPSYHIIQTATDPRQLFHILLSVITFSILSLAGLQAMTLAIQEKFLKQKLFEISKALPPLETMEKLLFEMIAIGALLLTLLLATSLYFFQSILVPSFLQKTILTFIAWCVFTLLLVGRCYFGWRGKKAIYCTLSGVVILTITYFSSMIILELLH
jgi:ABC-type uncharacterized transport system permease subunit